MKRKEIGGYIEVDFPKRRGFHEDAVALNSGRSCVAYLIEARGIEVMWIPDYMCDSVSGLLDQCGVKWRKYCVDESLEPVWNFEVSDGEYLYLVDYYGQLTDGCFERALDVSQGRLIVDEAQSLFSDPRAGVDTLYSPRKFLGIPDGGFLHTDVKRLPNIPQGKSYRNMGFLLGRYENEASSFYSEYQANNDRFISEPMERMSRLTQGLIGATDLRLVKRRRSRNYRYLAASLDAVNELDLHTSIAPFAYPLLVEGGFSLRQKLIKRKMYIPTLWPNVFDDPEAGAAAKRLARDLLPLPVDQRYGYREMNAMLEALREEGVLPRELAGKTVAILGGTLISCEIVCAAKRLGMKTVVIDYNPVDKSPAKAIADEHVLMSVADTDEVANYLLDNGIDGVICGYADSILGFYAEICSKAGLPCYGTPEQFELYTNKKLWKAECRRYGIPTAREYGKEILDLPESELPLPLFVKPIVGSGAQGTAIVRSKADLDLAYPFAEAASKGSGVLVEDYLEGPEVTVFWVMVDGEYFVTQIGNRLVKHNQEGVIPLPTGYTFPAAVVPSYLEKIAPQVKKMFSDQGICNGMMFMQCIVRDGTPYVYDIGYRLTGSLEHLLLADVAGYSTMDMLLRFAVTGVMTTDEGIAEKIEEGLYAPCYNVSCLMSPGTIDHFEGLDVLDEHPTVLDYVKAHVEGEILPPEAKGELRQIALRVLGKVEHSCDLLDAMFEIQDSVKIMSPEGEDLMLPGFETADLKRDLLDV